MDLTVIVSTGPTPFHPNRGVLDIVLWSLRCEFGPKIPYYLVIDELPTEADLDAIRADPDNIMNKWIPNWTTHAEPYREYRRRCRELTSWFGNLQLFELDEWGCQSGGLKRLMPNITTEFVFVTQHDLFLSPTANTRHVMDWMRGSGANYVAFERHCCFSPMARQWFRIRDDITPKGIVTGMDGYTDQSHLARTDWYLQWLPLVPDKSACELVLNQRFKASPPGNLWLRGVAGQGPFSVDLAWGTQPGE